MDLRASTTVTVKLGPFVDKTDGVTAETALSPTVKVTKNGGTLAARNSGTAITHDADGYYNVELNATDTNTPGRLRTTVRDDATHLPVFESFNVLSAAYYDEKYAAPVALTAGAASTATLDAGASATDGYYVGQQLHLVSGTGVGQTRRIITYVGSTKVATVDRAWVTNPASGTVYRLLPTASSELTSVEHNAVADALLDRSSGIETGLTPRQSLRIIAASVAAKLSGVTGGAGTVTVRNAVADSKNRLIVTNDANNNRTAITYDLT
jgi:hypothetical protein